MFFLGCILSMAIVIAPRLMLILAWIFSERWDVVWRGNWFWPLLGTLLAPYTTIMYMLSWSPAGIAGWDWMWIIMGVLLDIMKWGQIAQNRNSIPGIPKDEMPPATMA